MSRSVLSELGVQLGLCKANSPEAHQLSQDFLCLVKRVQEQQAGEAGEAHLWTKVN